MELVLKRKKSDDDRDPLLVIIKDDEKKTKEVKKIAIGEKISVPDHVGYEIMAAHKGMFEQRPDSVPAEYETKTMKAKG